MRRFSHTTARLAALVMLLSVTVSPAGTVPVEQPSGPGSGGTDITPGGDDAFDAREVDVTTALATQIRLSQDTSAFLGTQKSVRRLLTTMIRRMGRGLATLRFRKMRTAGPLLQNPEAVLDLTYGSVEHTDSAARGYSRDESLTFTGTVGESVQTGITLNSSRTHVRGAAGYDTISQGADAYANFSIGDRLGIGFYGTGADVDQEETDDGSSFAGGMNVSALLSLGSSDLTASAALTKTLRDVGGREHDTLLSSIVDVQTNWTDSLSTSVYAFFSDSLRNGSVRGDRTSWSAGFDIILSPNDRFGLTIGCEKTFAQKDYRDFLVNTSLLLTW